MSVSERVRDSYQPVCLSVSTVCPCLREYEIHVNISLSVCVSTVCLCLREYEIHVNISLSVCQHRVSVSESVRDSRQYQPVCLSVSTVCLCLREYEIHVNISLSVCLSVSVLCVCV